MNPRPPLLLRHKLWLLAATIALVHYTVLSVFGDPFNFGTLLSLGVAIIGISVVALRRLGRPVPACVRRWHRLFWLGLGSMCVWYLAMTTWMFVEARSEEEQPVDVVVVLGAGLKNGKPTPALRRRIERAAGYLLSNPRVPAVLCGGVGPGQPSSEAAVMRDELVMRGVSPNRLHLEEESTSTVENLRLAAPQVRGLASGERARVLLITSNFHLARAKMLARDQGFEAFGLPATTPWYILPNTTARESVAIVKSVLVDLR